VHRREGSVLTEAELTEWAHSRISNYKVPKRVLFVDEVPRTPVSKIDYPGSTARAKELLGMDVD
jgi:acyl-CoA synthetase (AMP-forming)/AMP-acid ligase II